MMYIWLGTRQLDFRGGKRLNKYRRYYHSIDFEDREVIKNLLYYRPYFEKSGFISDGTAFNKVSVTQEAYVDLIGIYADLDNIIKECNFSAKNERLLNLVNSGYTINYIYTNFENYNKEATKKMFNRIAERINERQREREKEVEMNDDIAPERRREKT